ncbi:winged helix-turn-helix domain-containing protein [Streptomyces albicerus]|uniref:winged helix-turn-helix domain-containing protein n=1 Tax=Streptomyces albicerus TaxID=2569859 RepID=UPI00124B3B9C|nr:winged helix-turn-helix domain-containing protein [Streptomyces albicerus]
MATEHSAAGGGRPYDTVLDALHRRLTDGKGQYGIGGWLPSQRALAEEFGVSRDTVQRVIGQLTDEGWIEPRQGSGTRVVRSQTIHSSVQPGATGGPMTLGDLIGEAFKAPEVALDVFTLTSESLDTHVGAQEERIRAGVIDSPRSITIRMLLPSDDLRLPYPIVQGDPADPRPQQRLARIRSRHTDSIRERLQGLNEDLPDLTVTLDIRQVAMAPYSKVYLFNKTQLLHGPYEPEVRPMTLDDGDVVTAIDVRGVRSTLTHYVRDEDPRSQGSANVESWQSWFDECWKLLTVESG